MPQGLALHAAYKNTPSIKRALKTLAAALAAYSQAGGTVHGDDHGKPYMAVRVKCPPLTAAPELREDATEDVFNYYQNMFWNHDFEHEALDAALLDPKLAENDYRTDFIHYISGGRSSGWFFFTSDVATAAAHAIAQKDILVCLDRWNGPIDFASGSAATRHGIEDAAKDLTNLLTCATAAVRAVRERMQEHIAAFEGKLYEALHYLFTIDPTWFDLDNCVITLKTNNITIAWPQHARTFKDKPTKKPQALECTLTTRAELIEILDPRIAKIRELVRT